MFRAARCSKHVEECSVTYILLKNKRIVRQIGILKSLVVSVFTNGFNVKKFYFPPIPYIHVLLTDLRRKRLCLLRGTNWVFNIIQANFDLYKPWRDSDGSRFDSRSILWDVLGRVALGQGSCKYFGFPLSLSFHQRSIRVFIYTLLLPEKQADEDGEPYKQQCSFGNRGL
jgi:hypothetical protein